nr:MAG TPA: hypothetical protein [Caudoviricetes sp.]
MRDLKRYKADKVLLLCLFVIAGVKEQDTYIKIQI